MTELAIVLLCNGTGADASSYKPNRDDSQWWNRRDSLVRCVTSALFSTKAKHDVKLILVFDRDWSRFEMRYSIDNDADYLPMEQNVVSLWQESAGRPHETVTHHGLSCRLIPDSKQQQSNNALPSAMDSKRQVLEYLQYNCSIEFLRKHGLNSNPAVVLRKANKMALMQVLRQWQQEAPNDDHESNESIEAIFQRLLKPSSPKQRVIAGILHESSDSELPCFQTLETMVESTKICLFLGAVRDMHASEKQLLRQCCKTASIPIVAIRLAPVAEFTSKILTVAAFHHTNDKLGPAMQHLLTHEEDAGVRKRNDRPSDSTSSELHVLLPLDLASTQISSDLEKRLPTLWTAVRATVCTLWRSRLASASNESSNPLKNTLSLMFTDEIVVTLHQDDLVNSLAEKHQAAPSEHQILKAIEDSLVTSQSKSFDSVLETAIWNCKACLYLDENSGTGLVNSFYGADQSVDESPKVVLLLGSKKVCKPIRKQFKRAGVKVTSGGFVDGNARDRVATSIVIVQHLLYQRKLLQVLSAGRSKAKKAKLNPK